MCVSGRIGRAVGKSGRIGQAVCLGGSLWVTYRVQARKSVCATRRAQAHGFYRFMIALSSTFRVLLSCFGYFSGVLTVFLGVFRVLLSWFGCVSGVTIVF